MKKKELKAKIKELYRAIDTLIYEPESETALFIKSRAAQSKLWKGIDELIENQRQINHEIITADLSQQGFFPKDVVNDDPVMAEGVKDVIKFQREENQKVIIDDFLKNNGPALMVLENGNAKFDIKLPKEQFDVSMDRDSEKNLSDCSLPKTKPFYDDQSAPGWHKFIAEQKEPPTLEEIEAATQRMRSLRLSRHPFDSKKVLPDDYYKPIDISELVAIQKPSDNQTLSQDVPPQKQN